MRPDVYTTSHKGLRRALTNLQYMAGKTHYGVDDEVQSLYNEMKSLWDLLDFHAAGEDELIHPHLEQLNKGVYDSLENEHEELVKVEKDVLAELEGLLQIPAEERVGKGVGFARNLNTYIARYLLHTQREESEAMPVLWDGLDDGEILKILGDFPKKASPQVMAYFLKYMLPAVNPLERHALLKGMKMGLPEPAFANIMGIAQNNLSESEFKALEDAIK